jgi:serine/threonine protein kinase
MNCPRCQQSLAAGIRFCTACGLSITASSDAPTILANPADLMGISRDPNIGRVLEGKYELLSQLGSGGMGAVYRARRVLIGDEVAVKVLHGEYVKEPSALERFRREARAAALLHHPNVVSIYDYGDAHSDGAPAFIVMELVGGSSLRKILDDTGTLSQERAILLMRSICAGVGAAHRNGVVHRDLKPDNIIVVPPDDDTEAETVKVVDFGIAKLRDMTGGPALTQTGIVIGTPYYMSPEQCRAAPLDPRSDVYSLAAMMYEMLAGSPPFTAETATGVVAKHLMEAPPPMPQHLGVSTPLEDVILRALAKDPDQRPADASAFARGLQTAAAAPPPATQPVPRAPTERYDVRPVAATRADQVTPLPYQQTPPAYFQTPPAYATPQPYYATPMPQPRSSRSLVVGGFIAALIVIALAAWGAVWLIGLSKSEGYNNPNAGNTNASAPALTGASDTYRDTNAGARPIEGSPLAKVLNGEALSAGELTGLNGTALRVLRNTIYARYGRIFDDVELQNYFAAQRWYTPRRDYSDKQLTDIDRANVALIKSIEDTFKPAPAPPNVANEVSATLEQWAQAMRDHDLEKHLSFYAPNLDTYYKRSSVSLEIVRQDKQLAFSRYPYMDVALTNLIVNVVNGDATEAVAIFDKTWEFVGDKTYNGAVKQSLTLVKTYNRWLITGERDLSTYNVGSR